MDEWTIRVRVVLKSEIKKIRTKKNADMDIINFTFVDRKGQAINVAAFNQVAEKFQDCLQLNFVYDVSNAQVAVDTRAKSGSNGPNPTLKLTLSEKTIVNEATDDGRIPTIEDRCCSLQQFIDKGVGETCSVICLVKEAEPAVEFTSRAGKNCIKRPVTICDPIERVQLQITIWGDNSRYEFENVPYIITDMNVGEYNGNKQYSASYESMIMPVRDHKFRRFKDLSVIDFNSPIGGVSGSGGSARASFE